MKETCQDATLLREQEVTKKSWEWKQWSFPRKGISIGPLMLKWSAWTTYIQVTCITT